MRKNPFFWGGGLFYLFFRYIIKENEVQIEDKSKNGWFLRAGRRKTNVEIFELKTSYLYTL